MRLPSDYPPLGTLRLCLISAVVIGIEAVNAVAGALIPPMLIKYGLSETQMSMILGIGTIFARRK